MFRKWEEGFIGRECELIERGFFFFFIDVSIFKLDLFFIIVVFLVGFFCRISLELRGFIVVMIVGWIFIVLRFGVSLGDEIILIIDGFIFILGLVIKDRK